MKNFIFGNLIIGKLIVILISITSMLIISSIGGLVGLFWGLSWGNYFGTFFGLIAIQLFIGKLWNYFIDKKTHTTIEKIKSDNIMAAAAQYVQLTCSYCGTTNSVKLYVGKNNTYKCEGCKETNSVQIATSSARTTQPIMPKAELAEIFKGIDNK